MMKKMIAMLLVVTMVFSLAACGGGNNDSQKSGDSADSGSSGGGKTLEFWVAWSPGEDTEKAGEEQIKAFEEATGHTVNVTVYTYDMLHDKVLAAAAGGNTPDLVWGLPEYIGEFYNMGILEDMTDAYESMEDQDALPDSVKEAMTIDGNIIGIPYEMTVRAYLTHDDMLAEAGAEIPETWDDLLALSEFKDQTGKYPFEISATGVRSPQELLVYLAQYDLEICEQQDDGKYKNTWLENDEQLEKASKVFQFYADLLDQGIVDPSSKNWGWEETDENFASGITATHVTGNWLAEREDSNPETMDDVSVSAIPYPADGKPATYMECKPLFVFNSSKNKEEAKELAKAVCSYEFQNAAFTDRSPRSDVFTETKWSKDFSALSDTGIVFPAVTLGGVTQAMIDSIAKVLQEGKTPEEAAEWLADAINASLKDSGELSE